MIVGNQHDLPVKAASMTESERGFLEASEAIQRMLDEEKPRLQKAEADRRAAEVGDPEGWRALVPEGWRDGWEEDEEELEAELRARERRREGEETDPGRARIWTWLLGVEEARVMAWLDAAIEGQPEEDDVDQLVAFGEDAGGLLETEADESEDIGDERRIIRTALKRKWKWIKARIRRKWSQMRRR